MADTLERLKVLLNSSTPIIVVETAEEMRVVNMVRVACTSLNLAAFEWSIASGLVRCGTDGAPVVETFDRIHAAPHTGYATGHDATDVSTQAIYNSREPAQALGNIEAISVEAAFILKDFHRHMEDPVVVRRLRDVGQKFSNNRRTLIITSPAISIPPELGSLVEYLELPLPDRTRLRQLIDEMVVRLGKTRTLKRTLDPGGIDALAENLGAYRVGGGTGVVAGHRVPLCNLS